MPAKLTQFQTEQSTLRSVVILLLIAILPRLGVIGLIAAHPERSLTPDSSLYLELGEYFRQSYIDVEPEYRNPSLYRGPGYPLLISLVGTMAEEDQIPTLVVAAQCLLSTLLVLMVFFSVSHLINPRAGFWTGVLLALDPVSLAITGTIRSETLFVFLLVPGFVLCWKGAIEKPISLVLLSGLLLGFATLVRAITLYLPIFLIPAMLLACRGRFSAKLGLVGVFLVGFLSIVGGWMVRNASVADGPVLSLIEGVNFLHYRAAGAIGEETNRSRLKVEAELREKFTAKYGYDPNQWRTEEFPARINRLQKAEGIRILKEHPVGAITSAVKGVVRLVFGPGEHVTLTLLGVSKKAVKGRNWKWMVALAAQALWLVTLYGLVLVGIVRLWRGGHTPALVLLGAVIAYFLLVSAGPEAYSRFRVPITPFLAILGGVGISGCSSVKTANT